MSTDPTLPNWQDRLTAGDIVRFRFPVDDPDNPDAVAKRRPCLVFSIRRIAGRKFAELAYGTGAGTKANRGFEVRVNHPDARERAGLDRPTRFIGARAIIVSLDNPGFDADIQTCSPIIGELEPTLLQRLLAVKAKRNALADAACSTRRA